MFFNNRYTLNSYNVVVGYNFWIVPSALLYTLYRLNEISSDSLTAFCWISNV